MKQLFTYLFSIVLLGALHAAPGDTTVVHVHDAVDMTWHGAYNVTGAFPDGSKSYRQVKMYYTLGCASNGCSDWDYTVLVDAMVPTGLIDSTISSIDTISTMPLIIDTTYNVFDVMNPMEIGRLITPYGGYMATGTNGFNNNWKHEYEFDVTDYASVLQDSLEIKSFYSGWSSGFSATIRFEFIEGIPPREVKQIRKLYKGSFSYSDPIDFNENKLPTKTYTLGTDEVGAKLTVMTSGHGFDNSAGCAEFCQREYYVKVDNTTINGAMMWDDQCGENPIFPQGGTWVYDRADWCPGTKTKLRGFELTDFLTPGGTHDLDIDLQSYVWNGNQTPSYFIAGTLFTYGAPAHTNDGMVSDILQPSDNVNYSRFNPICGEPQIVIKNQGSAMMTSAIIEYGVQGGNVCTYNWSGFLEFDQEEKVDLPGLSWDGAEASANPVFFARILSVNGTNDEYDLNDTYRTNFSLPPVFNYDYVFFNFKTNNAAHENQYRLWDREGNLLLTRATGTLFPNVAYKDTFDLDPGCYFLEFLDMDGDGLSWWNNSDGNGWARIVAPLTSVGVTVKEFEPDFGSSHLFEFVMGPGLEAVENSSAANCTLSFVEGVNPTEECKVFPNPNTGAFQLELPTSLSDEGNVVIFDLLGKIVYRGQMNAGESTHDISLPKQLANGIYLAEVRTNEGVFQAEVVVQR